MILGLTGKNASGKGEAADYLKTKGFVYCSLSDVLREEATKRGLEHSRDNLIVLGNELRKKYGASYLAQQINNKIKQQLKNAQITEMQSISGTQKITKRFFRESKIFGTNSIGYNKKNSMNCDINNKNIEKNNELKTNGKINNKGNNESNFVVDSIRNPYEAKELMKNKNFILVGIDAPIELRLKRLLERNRVGDAKTLEKFKQQEQRENLKSDTNQQLDATFKLSKKVILNDASLEQLHKKI